MDTDKLRGGIHTVDSNKQYDIIQELLKVIGDSQSVEGMPYSTSRELICLVRQLEVA